MSFPTIPDINPSINIKFEDAINILLASIGMEEISLSKLMDAETEKILCVVKDCKHKDSVLRDVIEINKSVDDTIKNMIKLQMLLQFKLDNIKEILPCTTTTTTTSTSTSTTSSTSSATTTHTTTSTTSTFSTTTKRECCCFLTGSGKGCVANRCDEFSGHTAFLYAFAYSTDAKNRTIRYSVGNDDTTLRLNAFGLKITMECPGLCPDKIVILGKGRVERKFQCDPGLSDQANFILTVRNNVNDVLEFRMQIISDLNPKLNHDSGFIQVNCSNSVLRFEICC